MALEIKTVKDYFLDEILESSMVELNKFFEFRWIKDKPSIVKISDRKTIDALFGRKTEPWMVGWAESRKIFVLDRKNYSKESIHKYSGEEYRTLVKHELAHLYLRIIVENGFIPCWLEEGVCIYVSGQNKFREKPKSFKYFLKYFEERGKKIYNEGGFVVEILAGKYGEKKLIEFLKSLKNVKDKRGFVKKFEKFYDMGLNYPAFNRFLKD